MAAMKRTRRVISKAKMYGIHPWVDQVDAIDQIIKDSGVRESIVLRKLLDEALIARRRKVADQVLSHSTSKSPAPRDLRVLEDLLLKLIRQGETSLQMQDVGLGLLQDNLAETRALRKFVWKQAVPDIKEQGLTRKDVAQRFDDDTETARDWAYGVAQEIKRQQEKETDLRNGQS